MKLLIILMTLALSGLAFADGQTNQAGGQASPIDMCLHTAMSEPFCISQINSKWFCDNTSGSQDAFDTLQACMQTLDGKGPTRDEIKEQCLGGYNVTANAEDNKTLCAPGR